MDSYKNVRRAFITKSELLSKIDEDLENLRKNDDSSLKIYIEISKKLIDNGLSIDMILNTEDDTFASFVGLAEEAQKLILESELVRQYVVLNESKRKLSKEREHLEDVLLHLEAHGEGFDEEYGEKVR